MFATTPGNLGRFDYVRSCSVMQGRIIISRFILAVTGLRRRFVALLAAGVLACMIPAATIADEFHAEVQYATDRILAAPYDASLYVKRGDLYLEELFLDLADADYSKALELEPESVPAGIGLARTLQKKDKHKSALTVLNKVLVHKPDDVNALVTRAGSRKAMGNHLAAAHDYDHVIRSFKSPRRPIPEYYLASAQAWRDAGEQYRGRAIAALDQGLKALGNLPALQVYAIELERERGHYAAALGRTNSVLGEANRKETWLYLRGQIHIDSGDYASATSDFVDALAAIDGLPEFRRHTPAVTRLRSQVQLRLDGLAGGSPEQEEGQP